MSAQTRTVRRPTPLTGFSDNHQAQYSSGGLFFPPSPPVAKERPGPGNVRSGKEGAICGRGTKLSLDASSLGANVFPPKASTPGASSLSGPGAWFLKNFPGTPSLKSVPGTPSSPFNGQHPFMFPPSPSPRCGSIFGSSPRNQNPFRFDPCTIYPSSFNTAPANSAQQAPKLEASQDLNLEPYSTEAGKLVVRDGKTGEKLTFVCYRASIQ